MAGRRAVRLAGGYARGRDARDAAGLVHVGDDARGIERPGGGRDRRGVAFAASRTGAHGQAGRDSERGEAQPAPRPTHQSCHSLTSGIERRGMEEQAAAVRGQERRPFGRGEVRRLSRVYHEFDGELNLGLEGVLHEAAPFGERQERADIVLRGGAPDLEFDGDALDVLRLVRGDPAFDAFDGDVLAARRELERDGEAGEERPEEGFDGGGAGVRAALRHRLIQHPGVVPAGDFDAVAVAFGEVGEFAFVHR